jgi:N6-L-threonylcarbamoyladenine synthase
MKLFYILAVESSCDDTAASVLQFSVENDVATNAIILSNIISSQHEFHKAYGGVVPEIAARQHNNQIDSVIRAALKNAKITLNEIDFFAVTAGPGLMGGLIVGVTVVKTLAAAYRKPFFAVNHLEGHALAVRIQNDVPYPYMLLLISGGHTQICSVKAQGEYEIIGESLDDALGETFDKVARMLKLPYPGGKYIEQEAAKYDCSLGDTIKFPRPILNKNGANFSFSGLKTSVRIYIEKNHKEHSENTDQNLSNSSIEIELHTKANSKNGCSSFVSSPNSLANLQIYTNDSDNELEKMKNEDVQSICACFQYAIRDVLINKIRSALSVCNVQSLAISGGVAANRFLFSEIQSALTKENIRIYAPSSNLCTDNAAMIAWAAYERIIKHKYFLCCDLQDDFDVVAKPRWPLSELI